MILVSAKEGGTSFEDCCLAMENMFIAAASLGIMSGWDHATVKDLFDHAPELKVGNVVMFGTFEQDNDSSIGGSMIAVRPAIWIDAE